jgi:hypothetical protein
MDADLRDLLSAWRGGDLDEARCTELLERLRRDEEFRRAFVAEAHLLGRLKAVQSTEPRWLLLEDELGWSADERAAGNALEQRVMRRVLDAPRFWRGGPWMRAALAAAVVLVGLLWFLSPRSPQERSPQPAHPAYVAVVVRLDGAQWEASNGAQLSEGSPLPTGSLRLRAGRATLTLFNGVMLSVQGPADLDLMSVERVFCREGKVRARVPPGADGFAVFAPGSAVVDYGTEFGLNVAADGKAQCMVFQGKAEVSVLNEDGHTLRSQLLSEKMAAEIDPSAGRIRDVAAEPDQFVAAPEMIPPALVLSPTYPDEVRKLHPWGYWRFETQANQHFPNEMPDRPALRAIGSVTLAGAPGDNHSAVFGPSQREQYLVMNDSWMPPRPRGYAVELWALSEEFNISTLVSLTSRADEPVQKHSFLLELTGLSHHLVHQPCRVRALDRWPPGEAGGVNVFSRRMYIPYRWHHLVAQKNLDRLELYLDGELEGTAPVDEDEATTNCRLVVGRLKTERQPNLYQARPFVGRLDELAVYDHPLSPADIRRHYELGTAGRPIPR